MAVSFLSDPIWRSIACIKFSYFNYICKYRNYVSNHNGEVVVKNVVKKSGNLRINQLAVATSLETLGTGQM